MLFQKKIGTVFLKEDSDASNFITRMQELEQQVTDLELKAEIQKQIKLASYGELGEKNISFELKNSGMDMYILHDIYLEYGDLSAQIDYLVITRKHIFVIECKNLIGNIEIDYQGNFIRTYEMFGKKVKEGIYSPITQNQRHLEVIKQVRKEAKGNFIMKAALEYFFSDSYKPLVVLANPKTYLNAKYAKKEIKDQVIRADQLITKLKSICDQCKDPDMPEKEMLEIAQFFLNANKPERSDYARKYEEMAAQAAKMPAPSVENTVESSVKEVAKTPNVVIEKKPVSTNPDSSQKLCPRCGKTMVLRTAAKGENVGRKFYGCSGFPKCRYVENI